MHRQRDPVPWISLENCLDVLRDPRLHPVMIRLEPSDDITIGNHVVCGPHVGLLIREGRTTAAILTSRDLIEVPLKTPMRNVIQRALAEQVMAALCQDNPDPATMPVWTDEWENRDLLIAELAAALFKSERMIRIAIRRKDPTVHVPECPWLLAGYEYMGAFRVERGLIVADRCYVHREERFLSVRTPCLSGVWHEYRRHDPNFDGRTVAVLVVHENHFDKAKEPGIELGVFGVDAGCAVIVDQRILDNTQLVEQLNQSCDWDEGPIADMGCFALTYDGDGLYRVRGIEHAGEIVAVRANLSRDETYDYHTPPPPKQYQESLEAEVATAGQAKPYAPSETFVQGDQVSHKKFGIGIVRRIVDAGKVEIAFPEGVKVLVHGQKRS